MSTIVDRLSAALAEAVTPADLAALDAEIARLTALRDLLRQAIGPASGEPAAEEPAGKPCPAAEAGAPPRGKVDRRLLIARAIERHGPLRAAQMPERTGIPQTCLTYYLAHPWFAKAGPHRCAPWTLTDAGRAALARAGEGPQPG